MGWHTRIECGIAGVGVGVGKAGTVGGGSDLAVTGCRAGAVVDVGAVDVAVEKEDMVLWGPERRQRMLECGDRGGGRRGGEEKEYMRGLEKGLLYLDQHFLHGWDGPACLKPMLWPALGVSGHERKGKGVYTFRTLTAGLAWTWSGRPSSDGEVGEGGGGLEGGACPEFGDVVGGGPGGGSYPDESGLGWEFKSPVPALRLRDVYGWDYLGWGLPSYGLQLGQGRWWCGLEWVLWALFAVMVWAGRVGWRKVFVKASWLVRMSVVHDCKIICAGRGRGSGRKRRDGYSEAGERNGFLQGTYNRRPNRARPISIGHIHPQDWSEPVATEPGYNRFATTDVLTRQESYDDNAEGPICLQTFEAQAKQAKKAAGALKLAEERVLAASQGQADWGLSTMIQPTLLHHQRHQQAGIDINKRPRSYRQAVTMAASAG
ncbi:hypothetical protein FPV67DRAFT_1451019 [Lyophyllum atratum]|nr:hypothetical protein FPV67DRAFT_1451019 [Lyophyllum atratum]